MKQRIGKGIKQVIREKAPFAEALYKVWNGGRILRQIRSVYGKDVHIFLMRGATGDTYLQLSLIHSYMEKRHISSYKIVADSVKCGELARLFREENLIEMNGYKVESIEKAYMLLGSKELDLTILFPWTYSLYFNRCRVRMTERFHFMDTYQYYVLNLRDGIQMRRPHFCALSREDMMQKGIVEGKTVVIAPEANSVTKLGTWLWNRIIEELVKKGYTVLVNTKEKESYCAPHYYCAYEESVPLLEYAGHFIGLRSGLCDIISSAKCQKVVIYPAKTEKADYSEHRTEIEFCGLKRMGLIEEEDDTLTEIDTPLVRNITDIRERISDEREREFEEAQLLHKILSCFRDL